MEDGWPQVTPQGMDLMCSGRAEHSRRRVQLLSAGLRTHVFSSFPHERNQDLAISFSVCLNGALGLALQSQFALYMGLMRSCPGVGSDAEGGVLMALWENLLVRLRWLPTQSQRRVPGQMCIDLGAE